MIPVLVSLALAIGAFAWLLAPLFGPTKGLVGGRERSDLGAAIDRSLKELQTDLELGKIQAEDLAAIQEHLEKEMGA